MTTQVDPALAAQIRNSDIINFVLDHFSKKSRRSFLEVLNNQRSRELQRSLLKGMRLTEKSIFESSVFRTRLLTGFEKGAGAAYLFVSLPYLSEYLSRSTKQSWRQKWGILWNSAIT